ncbi:putative Ig domain-containing protein, partial [Larkinella harenae]
MFTDANNDPLTYSLTGLPSGLSFDAGNRTIAGTPTQTGSFNLSYAATDGKSAPVSVPILLTVGSPTPGNQPPVAPTVSALTATVNTAFSQTLPVFTDANNDPLTYSLTGLPSGLSFDAGNRTISGSPTQSGSFNLSYAATDGKSAPVSVPILLTVGTSGGGPVVTGDFEGYLTQEANCNTFSGWVYDRNRPNMTFSVEFFEGASIASG